MQMALRNTLQVSHIVCCLACRCYACLPGAWCRQCLLLLVLVVWWCSSGGPKDVSDVNVFTG